MNWEDLRHFVALAKTGSFSQAGRRLRVDHTTVARRVAVLETALGLRLIDRLPRAVLLTEDGRRIAALGERMAEDAFAILRSADGARPEIEGEVRVSAPPNFAAAILAPALVTLRRIHPGIVVDLLGDARLADLGHREAEIAVRLSRPKSGDLIARKVGEMAFALYATTDYARRRTDMEWEFLAHDGLPEALPQQRWLDAFMAGRPVAFRASDTAALAAAAAAGLGVALLPAFLGDGDPRLARLACPEPPPRRDIWLAVHDDLRRAPRIRAVMDFLVETVGTCA